MAKPEESVKKSLKMLDLEYIDLYLLHWPKFFDYKNGKKSRKRIYKVYRCIQL